jgi:glycine/betaine/sarcosine/D-proline reductase family selenoprotein B
MPDAVKSDARWIADFRARFEPWWAGAQSQLAADEDATALATYPYPTFDEVPWTPFKRRLARCRVALVTTGGLFRPGIDVAFDGGSLIGDTSFRVIPSTAGPEDFAVAHRHFPRGPAEADINTIFPLALLRDAAEEGVIGYVAPTHYSTIGHVLHADELALVTAPTLAALMREEGVDVALLIPVSPICHQSGGLIQRELEASGIPTISLTNDPAMTARVRPPRSVLVRFPRGSMFGEPGNRAKQRTVLHETLAALGAIAEPGGQVSLDVHWEAEPLVWKGKALTEGSGS